MIMQILSDLKPLFKNCQKGSERRASDGVESLQTLPPEATPQSLFPATQIAA